MSKSDFVLDPNNPQEMSHVPDSYITARKKRKYFPRDVELESCVPYCVLLFRQSISQYKLCALTEVSRVKVQMFLKFSR